MKLVYTDALDYDYSTQSVQQTIGTQYTSIDDDPVQGRVGTTVTAPLPTNLGSNFNLSVNEFYFHCTAKFFPTGYMGISFMISGGLLFGMHVGADNSVDFRLPIGVVSVGPPVPGLLTAFNTIEIHVKPDNVGTGIFHVKVNGITVFNYVGNFYGYGAYFPTYLCLLGMKVQNICIWDADGGTGGLPDGFTGAVKTVLQLPVSDYNVQWTPSSGSSNYNLVNASVPNLGSTYVDTNVALKRDLYNFPSLPSNTGAIFGVNTRIVCEQDPGSSHLIQVPYDNSGTVVLGPSIGVPISTYTMVNDYQTVSPFTGVPWTKTEINSTSTGIELES
jgi:hypothetical protein